MFVVTVSRALQLPPAGLYWMVTVTPLRSGVMDPLIVVFFPSVMDVGDAVIDIVLLTSAIGGCVVWSIRMRSSSANE